jgi:hypothetical protein
VWDEFKRTHDEPMAGLAGVGCPAEVTDTFAALEEAGVDQVILLQQAAGYRHEHIMESLELFGTKVLPAFIERDEIAAAKKAQRLEHAVAAAQARIAPIEAFEPPVVDAYPLLWQKAGLKEEMSPKRSLEGGAFWKLQTAMNGSSASRANVDEGIES